MPNEENHTRQFNITLVKREKKTISKTKPHKVTSRKPVDRKSENKSDFMT